jgi:hypothetical protein
MFQTGTNLFQICTTWLNRKYEGLYLQKLINTLLTVLAFLVMVIVADNNELISRIHHPLLPVALVLCLIIIGLKLTKQINE